MRKGKRYKTACLPFDNELSKLQSWLPHNVFKNSASQRDKYYTI